MFSIPKLRSFLVVGILAVGALVASACGATDLNEGSRAENPTSVVTTPSTTPTLLPTRAPTPTQGPIPGTNRDNALAIRLGETAGFRFSIRYPDVHFYSVPLEKGTTYTVDLLDSLTHSTVFIIDSDGTELAMTTQSSDSLASSLVWTVPRSDTYFLMVIGSIYDSYTLTVTGGGTAPSQALVQTTAPGISNATTPSGAALTFASVSPGGNHTCGVTTTGAAYCWGYDFFGQLGNGPATGDQIKPVAVSGGLKFAMVNASDSHTCGVTTGGAAYCWGRGSEGRLGNGSTADQNTPAPVSGGLTFASVTAGINHSCGVTVTGSAYCWGNNSGGQLGNGASDDRPTPVAVLGGHRFATVAAGNFRTCGITTSGAVYCWGKLLAFGNGFEEPVSADISLASISEYHDHTCGVTTSGAAHCWGNNWGGQLGNGTVDRTTTPVAVSGGLAFSSLSVGKDLTCGVTTEGAAYCWGLGDVRIGSDLIDQRGTPPQTRPVAVSGGLTFDSVNAGNGHTCGVTTAGVAYCWGAGLSGRLGDGLEKNQTTPVAVASP